MTLLGRLKRQPQSFWLRKAFFQVHLWTGLGVGLYVAVISISGSLLVYRPQLGRKFYREPPIVAPAGNRLTVPQLTAAAQRAYPGFTVTEVRSRENPDQAVNVFLGRGGETKQRLFNPYTGADMGNSLPLGYRALEWTMALHDNLLLGEKGRWLNAAGGGIFILLCISGSIVWWPGIEKWRRSLTIDRKASWKRFTWELHSTFGFWTMLFILVWGISGIYLVFPKPFEMVVDYFEPFDPSVGGLRRGDTVLFWLSRLHFGRFGGWPSRVAWIILGLVPPILFITGALMWWNRSYRTKGRHAFPEQKRVRFGRVSGWVRSWNARISKS